MVGLESFLERFQSRRSGTGLYVIKGDRMLLVRDEDEDRNAALDRAVVFELGDGLVLSFWHEAVPEGEDAEIELGLIDILSRQGERTTGRCRHLLHDQRQHAHALARVAGVLAVLGQIEGGTAD